MFQRVRVSPSILSCDFMNLASEIRCIEDGGADWVHVDVMDGHFAPNLTVGVPIAAQVKAITELPVDVHLMISNPLVQLPWYLKGNPDVVTVHWEALDSAGGEPGKAARLIRSAGCKAGIALTPDTSVDVLEDTVALWDMVLVMSVFPGFSGQGYLPGSAERVRRLANLCRNKGCAPLIQVDGGINQQTAPLVCAEGADVLVCGNAVFKADDRAQAIEGVRMAGLAAQPGSGR
jgi:ribulose-phosphate 3-epimerase